VQAQFLGVGVVADFPGRMDPIRGSKGIGRCRMAGSDRSRARWPWSLAWWPISAGLSGIGVEAAICAATPGWWPLKPMPPVGRSVAVVRASAGRRGGPLDGRVEPHRSGARTGCSGKSRGHSVKQRFLFLTAGRLCPPDRFSPCFGVKESGQEIKVRLRAAATGLLTDASSTSGHVITSQYT
jgi:hypothetical protein